MDRIRTIFRNPVALVGMGFATFAVALFVAGLLTGGFSLAQEGSATATNDAATPTTSDGATASPEAQSTPTDKEALRDDFLNSLAKNLGVTRDKLDAALKTTDLGMVDKALADGKITADEAAKIRARIESGNLPFFFPGRGHHGHGGFEFGFKMGANLDDIANFLGINVQDVMAALKNNQSLAQIAKDHGKSRDDLKGFLVSKVKDNLDQAVTSGRITQAEADTKLADATTRIDTMIDHQGLSAWGHGMMPKGGPDDDGQPGGTMFSPGDF
jgi:uncharacterized protein YidB (DUF937 family)